MFAHTKRLCANSKHQRSKCAISLFNNYRNDPEMAPFDFNTEADDFEI